MVRLRTLNELADLKETQFGQPYPRHGLSLLWWFAGECIEIDDDGKMIAKYDPEDGDFGFRSFHNAEGLLPRIDLPYYEVGNLAHADDLPDQVIRYYRDNEHVRESNADRIVVSVAWDGYVKWFKKIYVTHHFGEHEGFDKRSTFRISQGLIDQIQGMEWSDYIDQVKTRRRRRRRRH